MHERRDVQVKSKTTSAELAEYVRKLKDEGPYERMFYVYHSGPKQMMSELTLWGLRSSLNSWWTQV